MRRNCLLNSNDFEKILFILFLNGFVTARGQSVVYPRLCIGSVTQNQLNFSKKFYTINEIDNRRFFQPRMKRTS
jgi:hypothetical protein